MNGLDRPIEAPNGAVLKVRQRRLPTPFQSASCRYGRMSCEHRLVDLIDAQEWSSLDYDVKGEIYEGLLARNAEGVRGGAGQYFTPRPVISDDGKRDTEKLYYERKDFWATTSNKQLNFVQNV